MTETPNDPAPAGPAPAGSQRPVWRRWPVVAGAIAVVLIAGVVAVALFTGAGRHSRGFDTQSFSPETAALELAVADAGGIEVIDDPGGGGDRDRGGPGRRGGVLNRLGDDTVLVGNVASVGNATLTVTRDGGGDKAMTTDDRTRVRGAGNASVGDLGAGERVVVRVGADNRAVGVLALRPHVAGTVTALDGDRATVVRGSGLTQIVDVSAVAEKPKVGDLIAAVGTLADNGTTLKAETVRQLPKSG